MHACFHPSLERSKIFRVTVNNHPVEIFPTGLAHFGSFTAGDGPQHVEVVVMDPPGSAPVSAVVRPLSRRVTPRVEGGVISFQLDGAAKVCVEIPGCVHLFLYGNPPETDVPLPDASGVRYFRRGGLYDAGVIELGEGETLYIEDGAWVRGIVRARGANVRIGGRGVLECTPPRALAGKVIPAVVFDHCEAPLIEGIVMIRPAGWMVLLGGCNGARVQNLKQIGEVLSSDGVDIVGSTRTVVEDCFLCNSDDNVVAKAFFVGKKNLDEIEIDCRHNVEDVLVQRCTLINYKGGNAMEVGHELNVDFARDIVFRDIDVLAVHHVGAVFSVHNNDRALVERVTFENIRIEHCYDKFLDLRISLSRYSTSEERGRIRDVTFRDVFWSRTPWNAGYTISIIGGWDAEHAIENITFDNVCIDGVPIASPDDLEITTRHARNVRVVTPK